MILKFWSDLTRKIGIKAGDKILIGNETTRGLNYANLEDVRDFIARDAVLSAQIVEPVEPGPLPEEEEGKVKYMTVTAVGDWTYEGNPVGSNAEGYQTTFWWRDQMWIQVEESVYIRGEMPEGTDSLIDNEVPSGLAVREYVGEVALIKRDYVENINFYNYTKDVTGKYINSTNGSLQNQPTSSVSEEIDVKDVDRIIIQDRTSSSVYRFLSESGTPMKALDSEGNEFVSFQGANNGVPLYKPNGAVKFQITTVLSGVGDNTTIYINDTGSKDVYFDKKITGVENLENINEEVFDIVVKNKFTDEIIEGKYIAASTGNLANGDNSTVSELVPVKPNTFYFLSRRSAGTNGIVGYAENKTTKNKVQSINGGELTNYYLPNADATSSVNSGAFKTGANTYYLQIGIRFNNTTVANYADVMLEEIGSIYNPNFVPSLYEPHKERYVVKEESLPGDITKEKNKIKILVIGNSFSQNSFGLVPKVLKELDPDLEFTIGIAYDGGSPLAQHYANFYGESVTVEATTYTPTNYTLYKNINGEGWSNTSKSASNCLLDDYWDIVTFQQGGGPSDKDYNIHYKPFINKLHKKVYDILNRNIKIGWVSIHGSYANNDSDLLVKYEGTIINTIKVLEQTSTSVLFPYGTAIQNARTTSLKLIGEGSGKNLMTDNAHLQAGIGELTACYCNALVLLNEISSKKTSLIGNKIDVLVGDGIVTSTILGMSNENRFLSQSSAINALKKPLEVTDLSVVESDY